MVIRDRYNTISNDKELNEFRIFMLTMLSNTIKRRIDFDSWLDCGWISSFDVEKKKMKLQWIDYNTKNSTLAWIQRLYCLYQLYRGMLVLVIIWDKVVPAALFVSTLSTNDPIHPPKNLYFSMVASVTYGVICDNPKLAWDFQDYTKS